MKRFAVCIFAILQYCQGSAEELFDNLPPEPYVHSIGAIYDQGRSIQLEDGTCWNVGYWPADYPKNPQIADQWDIGDRIEFNVIDQGVMKIWYVLVNIDKRESVNGWLQHGPYPELARYATALDENSQMVTLDDGSRWWIWSTLFNKGDSARIQKRLKGHLWICKQSNKIAYYLVSTSCFSGACLDVLPAGVTSVDVDGNNGSQN